MKISKEGIKLKNNKGITLVALVVTIIVLLILAGVALSSVLSQDGIFSKAEKSSERYNEAKARETLETVLAGVAQYEKYGNKEGYNQNEILNKLITDEIPGAEIRGDVAIIGGKYAYELDRNVPKIGRYLGDSNKLVFPTVTVSEVTLAEDAKSATFTITAEEQTKGINRIEIWLSGVKLETISGNNEKTVTKPYTVTRNGIYKIKAYADLSANVEANVVGIVPAIIFTPNGSTEWKKEHQVELKTETGEVPKSLKYKWTENGAKAPGEGEFTANCSNDNIVTGNNMTGTYYLWVLLETETGKKNICGSNAFNFDNTAPTAELATEWIEEETQNRLKITVSNATDEHSRVNENAKIYITPENGTREEKNIKLTDGTGEIIVDGLNIGSLTSIEINVLDNSGNLFSFSKKVGRMYLIKNGDILGKYIVWGRDSNVTESVDGVCRFAIGAYGKNSSRRGGCGIFFDWKRWYWYLKR